MEVLNKMQLIGLEKDLIEMWHMSLLKHLKICHVKDLIYYLLQQRKEEKRAIGKGKHISAQGKEDLSKNGNYLASVSVTRSVERGTTI